MVVIKININIKHTIPFISHKQGEKKFSGMKCSRLHIHVEYKTDKLACMLCERFDVIALSRHLLSSHACACKSYLSIVCKNLDIIKVTQHNFQSM